MWQKTKELLLQALYPFLFFSGLFLIAELYMQWKSPPLREVKPYHTSFTTHDGRRISLSEGPVQLALAPFTLYRNLPNQREPHFTINSVGLRGPEIGEKTQRKRILLLGASTAFGIGADNDGDAFAARLQRLNPNWEVINGAVIGFNSGQELSFFVTELVEYNPDLVISFDGYADIFDAWYGWTALGERKAPHELNYNMLVIPQIEKPMVEYYYAQTSLAKATNLWLRSLLRKSIILEITREKTVALRDRIISAVLADRRTYSPMPADYFEEVVAAYTANLLKIRDIAEIYGANYVAAFQPDLGLKAHRTPEEDDILAMMNSLAPFYTKGYVDAFNRFVHMAETRLRAEGIETFNTNEHPGLRYDQATLYEDSAHFNSEGHTVMAEILHDFLLNRERRNRGEPILPPAIRLAGGWSSTSFEGAILGSMDVSGAMPRMVCGPNAAIQVLARDPIRVGEHPVLVQCSYSTAPNTRGEFSLIVYDALDHNQFAIRRVSLDASSSGATELFFQPPSGAIQLAAAFRAAQGSPSGHVQLERFSLFELNLDSLETEPLLPANTLYNVGNAPGAVAAIPGGFQLTVSTQRPSANVRLALKPQLLTMESGSPVVRAAVENISRATGDITLELGGAADSILLQRRLTPKDRSLILYTGGRMRPASNREGWLKAQAYSESPQPSEWRIHGLRGGRMSPPSSMQESQAAIRAASAR